MKIRNLMIILFLSMAVLFLCQTGLASSLFNVRLDFEAGNAPYSVAMGDLNGDGILDLAVANGGTPYVSGTVSVLLGNGDGTFQNPVNYGAGDWPRSVALGDLDGDGDLDLVVANPGYRSYTVSVLLGNGDGTFQNPVSYEAGDWPWAVALGDLDGNGILDLAVADAGHVSNTVSVLLGNGDGTFQSPVIYGAGGEPRSVAIDDLNGDGILDLVVVNGGSASMWVLLGHGDGTFQSPVYYRVGYEPQSVAIGDLDSDGTLDLAVTNEISNNVSVLLGNGDGTFQGAVYYGVDDYPKSVAIGDLDGDGVLDLAVANWWSNNVSVLLGNGDGTFQDAVNYEAGNRPHSVAIGDLDGDGDLDLAVANGLSDNVSVLINSSLSRFERVYPKGWSMISLPVDPPDKRLNKLFPDAVVVYGYEKGTGYVWVKPDEDLEVGRGYWILLDNPQSFVIKGTEIMDYTMPVADEWYMIGGCSLPAQKTITSGKIDVVYGYTQGIGYTRLPGSGPLERGKGYWILFSNTPEGAEFTASTSVAQ